MGRIKAFLEKLSKPKNEKTELSPETQAKLDMLLSRIDEKLPPAETVRLKPFRSSTSVFDSKFGGVPYFPKGMEYPTVREGDDEGKPLYFLAQLNFEELPPVEGFPDKGILQFFTGCGDGDFSYGLDFEDLCDQNAFRIIYHENVITDENALYSESDMSEFEFDNDSLPFKGEFRLAAEESDRMSVTNSDFRYNNAVLTVYNDTFGTSLDKIYEDGRICCNADDIELFDAILETRCTGGTRIGGYPLFAGDDPRYDAPELAEHTVLLFQLDSDLQHDIDWGNHLGVGNFFITPEGLAKRDFSNVLYNWDCG